MRHKMKVNQYSIYDQTAEAFVQPFFMHNDGLAIRAFQDNVNSGDDNNIAKHPEQFQLYRLATFDDKSGIIEPLEAPKILANGLELKNPTDIEENKVLDRLHSIEKLLKNLNLLKVKEEVNK